MAQNDLRWPRPIFASVLLEQLSVVNAKLHSADNKMLFVLLQAV